MAIQQITDKKVSSIKKAEKSEERKFNKILNNIEEPLLGRIGYFWCNKCKNESVHRIGKDNTRCISCNNTSNFLIGENKVNDNMMIIC